jgi:hypothetical protein
VGQEFVIVLDYIGQLFVMWFMLRMHRKWGYGFIVEEDII